MKYERSVITMTLHWHSSQVSSLGNCVDDTTTETGLKSSFRVAPPTSPPSNICTVALGRYLRVGWGSKIWLKQFYPKILSYMFLFVTHIKVAINYFLYTTIDN